MTDETVEIASTSYKEGTQLRGLLVRCTNKKLDIYVEFGEYLSNKSVDVRYRIDKNQLVEESWFPSARGTAVFAKEDADLARQMLGGSTMIVEAHDYRGQSYRATFDLVDGKSSITKVLESCGTALIGMSERVSGLRSDVALEFERWGPRNISVNKKILAALGAYSGAQDTTLDPEFALAAQTFYDNYRNL